MRAFFDDINFLLRPDKRQKQIKRLAKESGWKYQSRRNYEKDPIKSYQFQLFEGRSGKRLKAIQSFKARALAGSFRVYDFHYFGDLNTKTTTVFEYYNSDAAWPAFLIKPKSGLRFWRNLFGEDNPVILTATPEFNESYEVSTSDAFALKENLTEEFLDSLGDEGEWAVEAKESALIYYIYGQQLPVNKLLERTEKFVHLVHDLETGRPFIK